MIYEHARAYNATYTIEAVVEPARKLMISKDLVLDCPPETQWELWIFNDMEEVVFHGLCDGMSEARRHLHEYFGAVGEEW